MMEKENKKIRDDARKEYNDIVRVGLHKSDDPRIGLSKPLRRRSLYSLENETQGTKRTHHSAQPQVVVHRPETRELLRPKNELKQRPQSSTSRLLQFRNITF